MLRTTAGTVSVTPSVKLVASRHADAPAVAVLSAALRRSGAATVVHSQRPSGHGLAVIVGRDSTLERALGAGMTARGLPSGGYVVSAGGSRIVVDGVDAAGTFYAAQTVRQLLTGRRDLPAFVVRDWPAFPRRGIVEGFYGVPWSEQTNLAMIDWLGQHKMNAFNYLPKDDPAVRAAWRKPLSPADANAVERLVRRAASDHVDFTYGISPGDDICYSDPEDFAALSRKLAALWAAGVRSFELAFDDAKQTRPTCRLDVAVYGRSEAALGTAQAQLVRRVESELAAKHPGRRRLFVVPTAYAGTTSSPYKKALARGLPKDVLVQWTGRSGISARISGTEAAEAAAVYAHPLVVWANFFVNDYLPGSLILGPLTGHKPSLAQQTEGITADPLNEPEASKIGLFTVADYAWNPSGYSAPRSWRASLAGLSQNESGAAALAMIAGANMTPPAASLDAAPDLNRLIKQFGKDWQAKRPNAGTALRAYLVRLRDAASEIDNPTLANEIRPWLDATSVWTRSALDALDSLLAIRDRKVDQVGPLQSEAQSLRLQALALSLPGSNPAVSVTVAGGALQTFVAKSVTGNYSP